MSRYSIFFQPELSTSCQRLRKISNRAAQLIVFQFENSVDQPATMQRERKLGQRWRFNLSAAPDLLRLVEKISDVDVENLSHAHHQGRAHPIEALFIFLDLLKRYA